METHKRRNTSKPVCIDLTDDDQKTSQESYTGADVARLVGNSKLLIQAVKLGNETLVRKLIDAGVPLYINDQLGCSPVYYAARYNHLTVMKMLVCAKAHINAATKMNRTPLQIAAYHGHTDCVVYLLQHNAIVDDADCLQMTALHWASENNHLESVRALLAGGADQTLMNKFGRTALQLAHARDNTQVCDLLRNPAESKSFICERIVMKNEELDGGPFNRIFMSDKHVIAPESPMLEKAIQEIRHQMTSADRNDTIRMLEQHGIKLLPVDESTLIANAVKNGQTAVLTEAGKLALKTTEPREARKLAKVQCTSGQSSEIPPIKRQKVEEETLVCSVDDLKVGTTDTVVPPRAKIIKINASQLVNLTANKKLIIGRSSFSGIVNTKINGCNVKIVNSKSLSSETIVDSNATVIDKLKEELKGKCQLLADLKKQLEISMQLAAEYKSKYEECKTRYEAKERQAALYQKHLHNLTKRLEAKIQAENVIR